MPYELETKDEARVIYISLFIIVSMENEISTILQIKESWISLAPNLYQWNVPGKLSTVFFLSTSLSITHLKRLEFTRVRARRVTK